MICGAEIWNLVETDESYTKDLWKQIFQALYIEILNDFVAPT